MRFAQTVTLNPYTSLIWYLYLLSLCVLIKFLVLIHSIAMQYEDICYHGAQHGTYFSIWIFWIVVLFVSCHPVAILTSVLHNIYSPSPDTWPVYSTCQLDVWCLLCRVETDQMFSMMHEACRKTGDSFLYSTFASSCLFIASNFLQVSVKMSKINCFQSSWLNGVHPARTEFWQMTQI